MKQVNLILTIALIAAAASALLSLALPIGQGDQTVRPFLVHVDIALAILYASSYSIGALLFLLGLKAFKQELRLAYIKINTGIVLFGISFAQVVVISLFDLWQSPWVTSGAIVLPFIGGGFLLFWGICRYAKVVGVKSTWMRPGFVLPLIAIGSLASSLLPHATTTDELTFDVNNGLYMAVMLVILASAMVSLRIKQRTGALYTNALAWLFIALVGITVTIFVTIVLNLLGYASSLQGYIATDLLLLIGSALYIRAGYAFSKLST